MLSLASRTDRHTIALQWDLIYPADQLVIRPDDLVGGSAALDAGKALTCALLSELKVYRCILVGGQKPISDGAVAIINFQVSSQARVGVVAIQIRNAIALTPRPQRIDIPRTDLPSVEGRIAVEAR
jgi:hypothetical protein